MKARHIFSIVLGCLLLVLGLGLTAGGGAIGVYELAARDEGGWHEVDIDRVASAGVGVTTEGTMVHYDAPRAVVDWLDLQMRIRVSPTDPTKDAFIGVGPSGAVHGYLAGVAHDEVAALTRWGEPTYRFVAGSSSVEPPVSQSFWDDSATSPGSPLLTWTFKPGDWTVAVLNASGQSPLDASATVGVRSGALLPIGMGMLLAGLVLIGAATALIVAGVRGRGSTRPGGGPAPAWAPPAGESVPVSYAMPTQQEPVVLEARLEPGLSRWLWLVKWFLAIPHFFVLVALWLAFGVTTVLAWFAILFTGQYPRSFFDFNVGVLRWSWRVSHYCGTGGIGTDRYPPFTLDPVPDDPVRFEVAYPERLSRGLIFVKWILLLPHWIVVALIAGTQSRTDEHGIVVGGWPGVLVLLVFVAGVVLLVTGEYAKGLFDVVVGLNRWVYRVIAYGALMTDVYPPFRYDGGPTERGGPDVDPNQPTPTAADTPLGV